MTAQSKAGESSIANITEAYYDSQDADEFYFHVWGGEDIHIGIYESDDEPIATASRRTVDRMLAHLPGLDASKKVIDVGAGYGGAARHLAQQTGCSVTCLNLSETQNRRNRQRNGEVGSENRIEVMHGSFEDIPAADASFDAAWSQDAILHSGNRRRVLEQVHRVLVRGGRFVFTDPMQKDDCPPGALQAVYDRIHLESLASFAFYRQALAEVGFADIECIDLTDQLTRHYARVRQELSSRYDEMVSRASAGYIDTMLQGLSRWVEAGQSGYLRWGIVACRKP